MTLFARRASPRPVVSCGVHTYPDDPAGEIRAAGVRALEIDARAVATGLGDARLANSVMLGAAAAWLPFPAEVLRNEILQRFGTDPKLVQANANAFDAGKELVS